MTERSLFDTDDGGPEALAAALAGYDDRPFYPLVGGGMPPPGPNFVAQAAALGDPQPRFADKSADAPLVEHGPALERLYRRALYDNFFTLPVQVKKVRVNTWFRVGHLWGPAFAPAGPTTRAEVMVVGKWPGRDETRSARLMVGPSGQLLRQVLREAGADDAETGLWYVTNLIRHENLDPAATRAPKAWIRDGRLLLEQELRLVRPHFVLALGREAAEALLGPFPGGAAAAQGRVVERCVPTDDGPHPYRLVTCLHPAAVLRATDRLPELRQTAVRFVELVRGGAAVDPVEELDHHMVWTVEGLRLAVDRVLADHAASGLDYQAVALDCEWHGEFWSSSDRPLRAMPDGRREVNPAKGEPEAWLRTIQFSHRPRFARGVVVRHGGPRDPAGDDRVGTIAFVPGLDAAVAELRRLFTSTPGRHVRLVGHNLKADLPWLCRLDPGLGDLLVSAYEAAETPELARTRGGFDTMYAVHAVQETAERKLELVAMNLCGLRRYDGDVVAAREAICLRLGIKKGALQGYGEIPDEVLFPYALLDPDATIRVYEEMTRPGGLLDRDQYGNDSWLPFWTSQSKLTAELEMETTGLLVDHRRAERLTEVYSRAGADLLARLGELTRWPGFNPSSPQQTRTVLFGPHLSGKLGGDEDEGWGDPRPPGVNSLVLGLTPVKTTGKPSRQWSRLRDHEAATALPSTDKESVGILLARALQQDRAEAVEVLRTLRHHRFVNRVLTGVLCPPAAGADLSFDEDGDMVFDRGFMASVEWDYRVRTHFIPIETGRIASVRPNCTNLSKRREKDLKDILGSGYLYPLRSIIQAPPGHVLVEADFTGAELMMMAIQSGSAAMVDHCRRANLPESDPAHFDIHTNVAVNAFGLRADTPELADLFGLPRGAPLPPRKSTLKKIKREELRDIAKTIVFGIPYGRGDEAVVRAVEELGFKLTTDEVSRVRGAIFGNYPELEGFLEACRRRVQRPGWIRSCLGRYRRFQLSEAFAEGGLAELERQAANFGIQSGVADCTTRAIRLLRHHPGRRDRRGELRYRLVAQIHDAVMSEVRVADLAWYVDEVLPACLTSGITVYPCDLDGNRLPGREGYHLGFEYGVYRYWGAKMSRDEGEALGLDSRFLPGPG